LPRWKEPAVGWMPERTRGRGTSVIKPAGRA
jgi:hypothetical protein